MSKKLKLLLITITLLLIFTLFACTTTDKGDEVVTSVKFANSLEGSSYELTIFSDMKFEFKILEEDGIYKSLNTGVGTYSNAEDGYNLTFTSMTATHSAFSLVYSEETNTAEEIAEYNNMSIKATLLSDSACQVINFVMFVNGEKGSRDTIIATTTPNKLYPTENVDYDFVCDINDTLVNQSLLIIHGDGYVDNIRITEDMLGALDTSTTGSKEVTITYDIGKTYNAKVLVEEGEPSMYTNLPNYVALNTTIEEFRNDTDNKIYYESVGYVPLSNTEVVIEGFNTSSEGEVELTFRYQNGTDKATIYVYDPDNLKDKEFFIYIDIGVAKEGELSFTASTTQSDGNPKTLTMEDVTVSGFDNKVVGPQVVTFTYGDLTYKKVIFVYDDATKNTAVSIDVVKKSGDGLDSIYLIDGALDFSNHKLQIVYVDGSTSDVALTEAMFIDYSAADLQKSSYSKRYTVKRKIGDYTYYCTEYLRSGAPV